MFNLTDRVALVTGASRGIGRSAALALAGNGADVALAGQNRLLLEAVAAEVQALGRRAQVVIVDLRNVETIPPMVLEVENGLGPIDILVNNAGINQVGPSLIVEREAWDCLMEINLRAPFFCATAVARGMLKRGRGKIINVSSEAGINGLAGGHAAYGASKGGLITLTKHLAVEWGPYNVQVNAVCPGSTRTDMTSSVMQDPDTRESILSRGVVGRICEPDEIGAAIVYLASSEADMVVGQALSIDGGSTAK